MKRERPGEIHVSGEKKPIEVTIIDDEQFWPGIGRAPNHDKIIIDYVDDKQNIPNT